MRGKFGGFTLIELIVVIGIMAVLMALVLPRFFTFNKGQDLRNEAENLKSALRTAQNNSASGVNKCTGLSSSNWFLKFSPPVSGNVTAYQTGDSCSDNSTILSDVYSLNKDVYIDGITLESCANVKDNEPKVIFGNISGNVSFSHTVIGCSPSGQTDKMTITLKSSNDPANPLYVIVEKGGSVYLKSN